MDNGTAQLASGGNSSTEIHELAIELARPEPGLSWLDVGCGRGDVLRAVRDRHQPAALCGVDLIDWLDPDLRDDVTMVLGGAEEMLEGEERFDRVLMVEALEHLDAPWRALRAAARRVAPGGRIVVSTPSVTNLRHRAELLVRGRLTSFRPDNLPHLTPALPHVVERVLRDTGLVPRSTYGARDVVPLTGGRLWPRAVHERAPELTSVSVFVLADAVR